MTNPVNTQSENLKRIPGLFRRWELPEIFEANCDYHIEDAGTHVDGTPLVALYSSGAQGRSGASSMGDRRENADPRDAIPADLLSEAIIAALPLTLDVGAAHKPLPLFSAGGATVGDLGATIKNLGLMLKDEGRKADALSRLHQELVAHGAAPNTGIFEMLMIIATHPTTSRTPTAQPSPRAVGTKPAARE